MTQATVRKMPKIGQKIIRILTLKQDRKIAIVSRINYQKTQRNNFTFRAINSKSLSFLRTKDDELWISMPNDNTGIVCFCRDKLQKNTIAFEVVGHTKQGNAVFVQPIIGKFSDLLIHYNFNIDSSEIAIIEE